MRPAPLAVGSVSLRLYPHDAHPVEQLDELRHLTHAAIAAGYDGVMISEHHGGFDGYLPNPQQMAGFLLAGMKHGWVAPCPLLLPLKPYALIAEELAWLSAAYPGQVGAGFASGALPVDFELAEVPFEERTARFKAALPKVVAALRGEDTTALADDFAVAACARAPLPMVVAAQSPAAVRRAAALGLGVLYDSLQAPEHVRRLSQTYQAAGGTGPRILIRRVWIGEEPTEELEQQLALYRSYSPPEALQRWSEGANTIVAETPAEAAQRLAEDMAATDSDTLNIRIHVIGLAPGWVRRQLTDHAALLKALRPLINPAEAPPAD